MYPYLNIPVLSIGGSHQLHVIAPVCLDSGSIMSHVHVIGIYTFLKSFRFLVHTEYVVSPIDPDNVLWFQLIC